MDTPHQTPTTIEPPQPFCNSPIQNMPSNNKPHANAITLDPAALQQQQGYANVKMHNPTNNEKSDTDMSKYNGNVNNNNNNSLPKDKNANQPFSIQNYSENHSEISC